MGRDVRVAEHDGQFLVPRAQYVAPGELAVEGDASGASYFLARRIGAVVSRLPSVLARSLTWDQGAEMAEHARLKIDAG